MRTVPVFVSGRLEAFSEQGSEGDLWALTMPGIPAYEGLHILKPGDALLIYGKGGQVAWQGTIESSRPSHHQGATVSPQGMLDLGNARQNDVAAPVWARYFNEGWPAVARLHLTASQVREITVLKECLMLLDKQPLLALAEMREAYPRVAERIEHSLRYDWQHGTPYGHWQVPSKILRTHKDLAMAWRFYRAREQAERGLWKPGDHRARQESFGSAYPTFEAFTEREVSRWLAHRLPHDDGLDLGN